MCAVEVLRSGGMGTDTATDFDADQGDTQDGTPIESGSAVEEGERSGRWIYTATKAVALGSDVFIEVKGCDHAGNKVQLTENPTVGEEA